MRAGSLRTQRANERDRVTAYHEAGHAVAAFGLNIRIASKGVNIDGGDGYFGAVHHSGAIGGDPSLGSPSDKMIANAERQVICALAGIESQRRYRASSVRNYHASGDYASAVQLLFRFTSSSKEVELWLRLLRYRTVSFVESAVWWPVIEGLADSLIRRRSMTGKETVSAIRTIMDRGLPPLPKSLMHP